MGLQQRIVRAFGRGLDRGRGSLLGSRFDSFGRGRPDRRGQGANIAIHHAHLRSGCPGQTGSFRMESQIA